MTRVQYVGRPSLDFYGKYLSEISKNLKFRGVGRVFLKESEAKQYTEPCFYLMKSIEPLMSDESGVRCRAFAERVFRGRCLGTTLIKSSYEPDWKLLSVSDGKRLQELAMEKKLVASDVKVPCIAPMPPLLAIKLRRLRKMPESTIKAARNVHCSIDTKAAAEANGFLLLTKIMHDPTLFQVPIEPIDEEKARIFPPYSLQTLHGLVRKKPISENTYFIRRSDTPGLRWRVELADKSIEDKLVET